MDAKFALRIGALISILLSSGTIANGVSQCPGGCICAQNGKSVQCNGGTTRLTQVPHVFPPGVVTVDLDNNAISVIETYDFTNASSSAFSLSVRNNEMTGIQQSAFLLLKNLHILYLSSNRISRLNKWTFIGLSNLQQLHLENNSIADIACSTFSRMPNIKYLWLRQNKLQTISDCTFAGLQRLVSLDISNNNVKFIGKLALNRLFALKDLSINNNQLDGVSPQWFSNKTLVRARLSGNPWKCTCQLKQDFALALQHTISASCIVDSMCIICHIPESLQSQSLVNVNSSYWDHCNLGHSSSSFTATQAKEMLNKLVCDTRNTTCSFTPDENISTISSNSIPASVTHLNVTNGLLRRVTRSTLTRLINLTSLQLSGNLIVTIENHSFQQQSHMKEMDASRNRISNVNAETFYGLSSLLYLNLQKNKIGGALTNGIFRYMGNLKILDLENNKIEALENCAFCGAKSLETLFLQGNWITTIHPTAFKELLGLQILNLTDNAITGLDLTALNGMVSLEAIYVNNNRWECTCKLKLQLEKYIIKNSKTPCENNNLCITCSTPISLQNQMLYNANIIGCAGNHGLPIQKHIISVLYIVQLMLTMGYIMY